MRYFEGERFEYIARGKIGVRLGASSSKILQPLCQAFDGPLHGPTDDE